MLPIPRSMVRGPKTERMDTSHYNVNFISFLEMRNINHIAWTILLRIPPENQLRQMQLTKSQYIRQYLQTLEHLCANAGIVIKLEETWYSQHLFEYSRRYHYKGIQVSSCLKKVSRLASEANQVVPSLNGDMSGLFSTGAAVAAEDSTHSNRRLLLHHI